ncbi:MAG TPA: amino acid adenylation domain-containing protein [Herpetosiphonaceae bacterium]
MTLIEFLSHLRQLGVQLWSEDHQLRYSAPKGTLTPALRAELVERKAEILGFLEAAQAAAHEARPAIQRRVRDEPTPASFAQQRLWFLHQLEPESPAYTLAAIVRLTGELDVDALTRSLHLLRRRHEALRTTFTQRVPVSDDRLVQQIAPPDAAAPLPVIDLAALPLHDRDDEATRLAQAAARAPFDLTSGPLLRTTLLRLDERTHWLVLALHHAIADGWSLSVFAQDLARFYAAALEQRATAEIAPPLPIQYADYAAWEQQRFEQTGADRQLEYWRRQLAGAPPTLDLPGDYSRPAQPTFRGAQLPVTIPVDLTAALRRLSQAHDATLFQTLLAAFQVLLSRLSHQTDILVGTAVANRAHSQTEQVIGCFVNTLVLRGDLSGDPTFEVLLQQTRQTMLDAYAHQDVPFDLLVAELQPVRDQRHQPLCQVMFTLQNTPPLVTSLPGLTLTIEPIDTGTAKFDLTLDLRETAAGLEGVFEYNTDVFAPATIDRWSAHFITLLATIAEAPQRPMRSLPLLAAGELREILHMGSGAEQPIPQDCCAHELISAQAARTPEAIALVSHERRLSYAELEMRANRLAHLLQARGVKPETRVGVCMERSPDLIVALLAILKAGGAYLPLDPAWPARRIDLMRADAGVDLVLTQQSCTEVLASTGAALLCLDRETATIAQQPESPLAAPVHADNSAYVIYTSGSTGQPKGVIVTQRALVSHIFAIRERYELRASDRVLQFANVTFDVAVEEIFPTLASGATLVLRPDEHVLSIPDLYTLIEREHLTVLNPPTAYWHSWVEELAQRNIALPRSVRLVIGGGEAIVPERLKSWQQLVGSRVGLINAYGPTETTVSATSYTATGDESVTATVPIGRPMANTHLYILDAALQPVPIGVIGELYIGGERVARGYLNRPELTAERFIPDPWSGSGTRIYRTGDLARYRADGNVEFVGRGDNQVKIRGFRIELGEIEAALARHPGVREAVVVARADQGEQRLVAYVVEEQRNRVPCPEGARRTKEQSTAVSPSPVATDGYPLGAAGRGSRKGDAGDESLIPNLRSYLRELLPEYMIPSVFVPLDTLPLTTGGKIDRWALPAPEQTESQASDGIAPRTAVEQRLAAIWSEVLGRQQIGVEDSFFAIGGHSLLATRVISRLRDAFAIELPLRKFFERPTIAGLALAIETAQQATPAAPVDSIGVLARGEYSPAIFPAAFAQRRLWFLDQWDPGSSAYHLPVALRLAGALDTQALEASLNALTARHETLRTTFAGYPQGVAPDGADGQPVQQIHAPRPWLLPLRDLSRLPLTTQPEALAAEIAAFTRQPFDLTRGPLLRARLLRLQPADDLDQHLLLLNVHHIVVDGWSLDVLLRELAALYNAALQGLQPDLAPLPIQYADYAAWQQQQLQGERFERLLDYWRRQLAGLQPLALPTDHPRPSISSTAGTRLPVALAPSLVARLSQLSQQSGTTMFMLLLATLQVLLHRYSGQTDIAVGTPIANRTRAESEGLVGFLVNTLVLRADLSGRPAFAELLQRVRSICLDAYAHQDLPFELLVEELQPERSLGQHPLFQVLFVLQTLPPIEPELAGLAVDMQALDSDSAKFDLTLDLRPGADGGLHGYLEYATDLFETTTIQRMLGHLQTLLHAVVANPEERIAYLPLLTDAERQQSLIDWNRSEAVYPRDAAVHTLIEAQAERSPETTAIVFEGAALTYAELNTRANQLAHHLRAQGVGPDVLVALMVERGLEMIVGMLAILKAGGAYVPLDPAYPADRLQYMLSHSQAPVILTQAALVERLPDHQAQVFRLDADRETLAAQPTTNPPRVVLPEQLAYIIFTSGSTGRPKGVMVQQQGLINLVYGLRAYFDDPAVTTTGLITSISFDISVNQIFPTLIFGRTLHIISDPVKFNSRALVRYLDEQQIQLLDAVPSYIQAVLNEVAPEQPTNTLRYLLIGGEKIEQRLLESVFGQLGPAVQIINIYGLTEISDINILGPIRAQDIGKPITVGRPLHNNRIYILDACDQPQPVGIAGEVCVAGASVSRGYLHRPELTAERFVVCPFEDSELMVRTGDLGRWHADGTVEILGRIDHQVKLRGFRIETGEIEAVLVQHEAVREAVVVVREDRPGDARLVAYIEPRTKNQEPNESQAANSLGSRFWVLGSPLREFLAQRLPAYMLPSAFVSLEQLPHTPSGKIDRRALPAPEQHDDQEQPAASPSSPTEILLADIWATVLDRARVGRDENFFDLGGHSLLATQVIAQIRTTFAVDLPLRSLFEHPTVAALTEQIAAARSRSSGLHTPPLRPQPRPDVLPLAFAQQRLWLLAQLDPHSTAYHVPLLIRLSGPLDTQALEASLNALTARHETLRTTFAGYPQGVAPDGADGQPVQQIHAPVAWPLPRVDLSGLPPEALEAEIGAFTRQPFDLTRGPLLRARLLRLPPADDLDQHLLVLNIHHIVVDGWSLGVLVREMAASYRALRQGLPPDLPPLPIQYADYALWQRDWLCDEQLERLLSYWRRQLADLQPLALPTDYPRPAEPTFKAVEHGQSLSAELSAGLATLSRQSGVTLFMTLLAALDVLLYRYSGQDDIVVGTDIANRTQVETEGLIGFFVNMLALRCDLSGNPTFAELLSRVRSVCLQAYAHQDLPFDMLVNELQIQRDPTRAPLFQVVLVLQNMPLPALELEQLTVEPLPVDAGTAKFDLVIELIESGGQLRCMFKYDSEIFKANTIARMIEQFSAVLDMVVRQPDATLHSLAEQLSAADHEHQLRQARDLRAAQQRKLKDVRRKTLSDS